MITLSIRQPWAWLVVNGHKPIENREWSTSRRGPILIHAGKTMTKREYQSTQLYLLERFTADERPTLPPFDGLLRGGIVGGADLVGCVTEHDSPWFEGAVGLVFANARPLPFYACNGQLGFFNIELP